jgi:hypothetical protein
MNHHGVKGYGALDTLKMETRVEVSGKSQDLDPGSESFFRS